MAVVVVQERRRHLRIVAVAHEVKPHDVRRPVAADNLRVRDAHPGQAAGKSGDVLAERNRRDRIRTRRKADRIGVEVVASRRAAVGKVLVVKTKRDRPALRAAHRRAIAIGDRNRVAVARLVAIGVDALQREAHLLGYAVVQTVRRCKRPRPVRRNRQKTLAGVDRSAERHGLRRTAANRDRELRRCNTVRTRYQRPRAANRSSSLDNRHRTINRNKRNVVDDIDVQCRGTGEPANIGDRQMEHILVVFSIGPVVCIRPIDWLGQGVGVGRLPGSRVVAVYGQGAKIANDRLDDRIIGKLTDGESLTVDGDADDIAHAIRVGKLEYPMHNGAAAACGRAGWETGLIHDAIADTDAAGVIGVVWIAGIRIDRRAPIGAAREKFTPFEFRKLQRGRRKEVDDGAGIANSWERQIEVAASALGTRCRCGEGTVGTGCYVDVVGLKRSYQGFLGDLDIVDDEGGHMQRRVLDNNASAVWLNQYKVVAIDLDPLDRGAGRQLHRVVFRNRNDRLRRRSAWSRRFDSGRWRGFSLCNLDLLFALERHRALNLLVCRIGRQILSEAFGSHRQTPCYLTHGIHEILERSMGSGAVQYNGLCQTTEYLELVNT